MEALIIGLIFFGILVMVRTSIQPEPPRIIYIQTDEPIRHGLGCVPLLMLVGIGMVAFMVLSNLLSGMMW